VSVLTLKNWGWRNEIYFYQVGPHQKLKSGNHPHFLPNIQFFQHFIGYLTANTTMLG
jgi:hypothetical protein